MLVKELKDALDRVPPKLPKEWRREPWTRAVKEELCRWGLEQGFYVYAHSVEERFRQTWPKDKRPRYEWLFDVTCLAYTDDDYLERVPLVAECEWGCEEEIHDDFEKLLVARAEVRVMVFDGKEIPGADKFAEFKAYIRRFAPTGPDDLYLLAAYREDSNQFEYCVLPQGSV